MNETMGVFIPREQLVIDPEFQHLMPPLSQSEREGLRAELAALQICLQSLIVWKETMIVLDGQTRLEFCQELNIPYRCVLLDLADRAAARKWIIAHQMNRRNLSGLALSYWRGDRYLTERQPNGGLRTPREAGDQDELLSTAERLGLEYDVGHATIKRDGQLTASVDSIVKNCGPEAKNLLLARASRLTRARVLEMAARPASDQKKDIQELKVNGRLKRKARDGLSATITLPRDLMALAQKLVQRVGCDNALEVSRMIVEAASRATSEARK